jgi:uncharacterized membrane protein YhaH (DUF805 family)
VQLTNSREIAAFFLALLIAMAILVAASPLLVLLYLELRVSGSAFLLEAVGYVLIAILWVVALALLVVLRGGFGGVPPRVGGGRRDAVTTSAGEIGACIIALLVTMVFGWFVLADVHTSFWQSSGAMQTVVYVLSAVAFFLIFIAVRRAVPGLLAAEAPIESYDDSEVPTGFGAAIATCLRKYAVFRGRASRSEYWYFVLFQVLLVIGLMTMNAMVSLRAAISFVLLAIVLLFMPGLAATVRRLHDVNMSGWWAVLTFVPLVGLYTLVWLCGPGTEGPNRFGRGPVTIPEIFA